MSDLCAGHLNDIKHLEWDGFEGYDLGFKFEEKESDEYGWNAGSKAYAEPFLALYISVRKIGSQSSL
jgi:hypothetical protein